MERLADRVGRYEGIVARGSKGRMSREERKDREREEEGWNDWGTRMDRDGRHGTEKRRKDGKMEGTIERMQLGEEGGRKRR